MRAISKTVERDIRALRTILDPRWGVRWVYVGRLCLASALVLALVLLGLNPGADGALPPASKVLLVAVALSVVWTTASWVHSHLRRQPLGPTFIYLQVVFDLLLVTATVDVTDAGNSQFAALYILVIAYAALFLPLSGAVLSAVLAIVLYGADVFYNRVGVASVPVSGTVIAQLGVFGCVAVLSGLLSSRLRQAGTGGEELATELVNLRMQAEDILRNIRSGIITVDARGNLLSANPAASALLGVPLEPSVGRPVLALLRPLAPELATALERTVTYGIRTTRAEGTITGPKGPFSIGVTTTFVRGDGNPDVATAIFQDISDQKRLELLNMRAQRLEAVAALSASLAHEIRNPLASIRSAVEQLAGLPQETDDGRVLGALIVKEADRLSRLLAEFLDFARVRVTRLERVHLGDVACGAVALAETHPDRQENVTVRCVSPIEPLMVEGDEDLLHRAIFNLVLNALQATPAGGRVDVEVGVARPDQFPAGRGLDRGAMFVTVRDSGSGISAEIMDRIFEPFMTTKPGGSGLGLAMVHRAIESHHGIILVDSSPRGTCFSVFIPSTQSADDRDAVTGGTS